MAVQFLLPQNSLYSTALTLLVRANCKPLLDAYHMPEAVTNSLQMLHFFEPHNHPMNYLFNYYAYFTDEKTKAKEIKYLAPSHS